MRGSAWPGTCTGKRRHQTPAVLHMFFADRIKTKQAAAEAGTAGQQPLPLGISAFYSSVAVCFLLTFGFPQLFGPFFHGLCIFTQYSGTLPESLCSVLWGGSFCALPAGQTSLMIDVAITPPAPAAPPESRTMTGKTRSIEAIAVACGSSSQGACSRGASSVSFWHESHLLKLMSRL